MRSFVGNRDRFKARSNKKARPNIYKAPLTVEEMTKDMKVVQTVAWCRTHPSKTVGINPKTNKFYTKCYSGFSNNEVCEIVIDRAD